MYEIEKLKIKQMLGSEVYDTLKETKCVLAGGAITSLFTNREINDFDLYFTSKESLTQVFAQAVGVSEDEFLSPYDLIIKFATKRSMLCVWINMVSRSSNSFITRSILILKVSSNHLTSSM